MRNFFCDFETYYDKDYSLSKMPTEQYIMDDRFEAIMMSYSTGGDVFVAIGEERIKKVLAEQDWANTMVISHNTNFDGLILRHRFGVKAARYADTMAMARTTGAHIFGGASLDAVAKVLHQAGVKIPFKGNAVHNNSYKHLYRHSPTNQYYMRETPLKDGRDPETLAVLKKCSDDFSEYVVYCRTDTLICMKAYEYFRPLITNDEMMFADMMIKCMVDPIFYLDEKMLEEELVRLEERNKIELQACADKYFGGSVQKTLTTFRSAKQFSEMLRSLGGVTQSEADEMTEEPLFIIPTKINDSGKESFTFGKTSLEFLELAEGDIPEVSELCKLKLECTSSIEKSRTEKFLALAKLRDSNGQPVPFSMPYIVNQAGTLRLGAGDSLNVMNLPSGRKKGQSKALRKSIMSPQGYSIIVADASQIEARLNCYASNESWLLEAFAKGRDPYSIMASFIYGGNPDEIKKQAKAGVQPFYNQRQVGKTAILSSGYGSGAAAFKAMLKVQSGLDFTLEECQDIVKTYRTNNREIANFWNKCSKVLDLMIAGQSGYFGGPNNDLFFYDGNHKVHGVTMPSVRLPDGNWLRYYKLERKMREYPDGSQKMNYCYWGVKERKAQTVWIYGSKFAENLIQALAFALMKQQALLINKWSPIRLNTHDEWGICVPTDYAQAGLDYMLACMKWTPQWATGLPLDAEGDFALRYGECK